MGFLDYSNQTQSNIIPKEEFDAMVQEVFTCIASNLCKSLGPLGSSATILDGMQIEATKDGHSILSKYRFHNRYKKMIYKLITAPCERMNNTVGDATTTAIALTSALYNRWMMSRNVLSTLYRLPRQFTQEWDYIINELMERSKGKATPIVSTDYDTIYNIAYVTSNGNKEVSDTIAKVYHESGTPSIRQKDSPTNKSYIKAINGYDFPCNLISDAYVRNEDLSVEENDIYVMIVDFKIETDVFNGLINMINDVIRSMGSKLLLIAPTYDKLFCDTVLAQHISKEFRSGGISLITAQYSPSQLKEHELWDLATIARAKVINQDHVNHIIAELANTTIDKVIDDIFNNKESEFYGFIGKIDHALLTCKSGSVFRVNDIQNDEEYQRALNRAKNALNEIKANTSLERQAYAAKIYDANSRVLQLEMKNYIYYIGADSNLQKNITWDAVEDVIKCTRSATKYGIVPGCQLSLISSCSEMMDEILKKYGVDELEDLRKKFENEEDPVKAEVYDKAIDSIVDSISKQDKLRLEIIRIIHSSLIDVYSQILHGADGTGMIKTIDGWEKVDATDKKAADNLREEAIKKSLEIITESVERNQVFDLENLEFSSHIITSAETDSMVISVASELVKILISGNQCIFLDADVDESHEEQRDVYV